MHPKVKSFSQFFYSSHFNESIKITIGILTPALILAQFQKLELGIALSLGAMCGNIVDSPGPMVHRRNAMLINSPLLLIFTFLSCIIGTIPLIAGIYLALCSFVFTMLYVYSVRAASVGISVLLMVVLSIDDQRSITEVLWYSLAVCAGSVWYTALSYAFHRVRPYRFAQQSIAEYMLDISDYLRIKADFYQTENNYEENYKKLLSKQIVITEEQEAIRDILFTTRNIVKEGTPEGRFLTQVFRDSVDLFEQLSSTQYHYKELRNKLAKTNILYKYRDAILHIALEVDNISYALNMGDIPKKSDNFEKELISLKTSIHNLEEEQEEYGFSEEAIFGLKNILANVNSIVQKVAVIQGYFSRKKDTWMRDQTKSPNLDAFITRKKTIDFQNFKENLSFKSNNFRFALRFTIIMVIGYVVSKSLNSSHSYWVLLSILVILKPGFSQTKQRNIHRTIGTLLGGLIGLSILYFVHNTIALFFILLFCMLMAFSFMRKNYVIYVLFMTPYLFAAYSFLGIGNPALVQERILDTFIGAIIAFLGTYILFPTWTYQQAKISIHDCLLAINNYFMKVSLQYSNESEFDDVGYKLARKRVNIQLSNMATMVNNMFEEPKSKQIHIREIQQINSLMHLFSSYTASLFLFKKEHNIQTFSTADVDILMTQIQNYIQESAHNLDEKKNHFHEVQITKINLENYAQHDGFKAVRDMMLTIQNLAAEIFKISNKLSTHHNNK